MSRAKDINFKILKLCREQLALSLDEAQKKTKIKTLAAIEQGTRQPTFNQINRISNIYLIPTWVFFEKDLPKEYNFKETIPSFRRFINTVEKDVFNYKIRSLVAKVEGLRETILGLEQESENPYLQFDFLPPISNFSITNLIDASRLARKWLENENKSFGFSEWRKKIEQKGVFVFVTCPLSSWSKMDPEAFRGLSIYYNKLPIIIVNGSDSFKAKSFTLFHELGHLLKKKTMFDKSIEKNPSSEEKLCDNFAGEILMPTSEMMKLKSEVKDGITSNGGKNFKLIEEFSKKFKVSRYAFLVRLKKLNFITQEQYKEIEQLIKQDYQVQKDQSSQSDKGFPRVMPREKVNQYGNIYTSTVMKAYLNKEITLYSARKMFELKKSEHVLKIKRMIS